MKVARYKKGFIKVDEYSSKLHFGKIFCPDCNQAKLKLVRKANQKSYFEFIKGEEHDELCPRAVKPIDAEKIKELMLSLSSSKKDMSKLNFLVNKNLEKCINLLVKVESDGQLKDDDALELMPRKKQHLVDNRIREYSKQDIFTINALDLPSLDSQAINGKYVVIYGVAGITLSSVADSKRLLFKVDQDTRFSIFIAPSQVKYLEFEKGKFAKFAVFGKFKKVGSFSNLEIRSTRDLVIKG